MNKRSFKYAWVLDKQKAGRDVYKIGGIGIVPVGRVETDVVKPVNLAVSLEKMCRVKARLLDVDIYVPSITLIMCLQGKLELSNSDALTIFILVSTCLIL
ncbi:hypothetical protein BC332_01102 [Capsicum chinense]|nr:hypothetical protein BC332_01102 [Capsicum chinense]